MSLESLANELLFDLFDYFTLVDLFHSFNGLNNRFDKLLLEYFQIHKCFDFRLILKEDLNLIRRRYLPLFINEIKSICLSDDDTNPHEIDLFLSRLYPLYRFNNLKSISFYNIYSIQKMIRILNDLQQIPNLTTLNFHKCHFKYDLQNLVIIMNNIWSLPNLINCYLDISFDSNSYLITPTIISCSIQYLSIRGFRCGIESLQHLYEQTPCLKDLSIDILEDFDDDQPLSLIHSITTFRFQCNVSSTLIQSLLRKMPNLINLTVETKILKMDGHMWQNVINKYLPSLKIFNLKMEFELNDNDDIEQEIDNIIDTYRTQFWINQHKWFICCFGYVENGENIIHLHTLPYRFQNLSIHINDNENFTFKSTCPEDKNYLIYNYVQNLNYSCYTSEDINLPEIHFPNIENLTLTLPHDDHFRFNVPRFDNLISLQIRMISWGHIDNELLNQLQILLDQASRLYYLKFHSWSSPPSKTENKNKKVIIRNLN
jgi:hypothetical protein